MSVNKFMHARNIYKTPPDFAELAKLYPEFDEILQKDDKGKQHIDFKDPRALRFLTKCLCHRDFGLNIYIPEDRLVPTLPLRLNYILWIEDLLKILEIGDEIAGIDIGTGACAIYPLLAAAKNKWKMLGTEKDETSFNIAFDNVKNNNLEHMISLKLVTTETLLEHCFTGDVCRKYDFSMCNPPFYSSLQELCESRNTVRPPPKNAFTGSLPELVTEGGEVEFITRIIDESLTIKENIRIFTTMVGHKASLKELVSLLRDRGIQHTHTEFCQGHTTRWGLAWTFLVTCNLQLVSSTRENRKKNNCMAFIMQPIPGMSYDTISACTKVKDILNKLEIAYKLLKKKGQKISLEIKAHTNTWSNQRRKRRQQRREMDLSKKSKLSNETENQNNISISHLEVNIGNNDEVINFGDSKNNTYLQNGTGKTNFDKDSKVQEIFSNDSDKFKKRLSSDNLDHNENSKTEQITQILNFNNNSEDTNAIILKTDPHEKNISHNIEENVSEDISASKEVILHAILSLCKVESDVVLDMEYLSGSAGKDGMHQVVQYIKNNWK